MDSNNHAQIENLQEVGWWQGCGVEGVLTIGKCCKVVEVGAPLTEVN
jgi:hypothetical protein